MVAVTTYRRRINGRMTEVTPLADAKRAVNDAFLDAADALEEIIDTGAAGNGYVPVGKFKALVRALRSD